MIFINFFPLVNDFNYLFFFSKPVHIKIRRPKKVFEILWIFQCVLYRLHIIAHLFNNMILSVSILCIKFFQSFLVSWVRPRNAPVIETFGLIIFQVVGDFDWSGTSPRCYRPCLTDQRQVILYALYYFDSSECQSF